MNANMDTMKLILLLIPVYLIQLTLQIYSLINIIKRNKFKYLNKWAWVVIVIFGNLVGAIIYLILRGEDDGSPED